MRNLIASLKYIVLQLLGKGILVKYSVYHTDTITGEVVTTFTTYGFEHPDRSVTWLEESWIVRHATRLESTRVRLLDPYYRDPTEPRDDREFLLWQPDLSNFDPFDSPQCEECGYPTIWLNEHSMCAQCVDHLEWNVDDEPDVDAFGFTSSKPRDELPF